ncbi:MAG: hypothetical protein U1F43_07620 [Myxococcota bacterium]
MRPISRSFVSSAVAAATALLGACSSASSPGAAADALAPADVPTLAADTTATATSDSAAVTAPDAAADAQATTTPSDTAGGDTSTPGGGKVGDPCATAADCEGPNAYCIDGFPGGYCSRSSCDTTDCPDGSTCFTVGDESLCVQDCAGAGDCRTGEGYVCDSDETCWYYDSSPAGSPIGGPCSQDSDCKDGGAWCYPATISGDATGFFAGYCMADCASQADCPSGSICDAIFSDGSKACVAGCTVGGANTCGAGYRCFDPGICFPGCVSSACPLNYACDSEQDYCTPACSADTCPDGTVCHDDGTCGDPPCQDTGCEPGYVCAQNGACVVDVSGGPGAGPGPACPDLPQRDCSGTAAYCGELIQFDPNLGPGYWDYPINGETDVSDEYRSWSRRDLQMLIKWAAAVVECKAKDWAGGNGKPDGLGDMSEADGSIPGTREGSPGHPEGTHEMGYDTDFAYFQTAAAPDNKLRPICPHLDAGGAEAYHCTGQPTTLDLWRSAMMLGTMMTSGRVRVIGVDGKVGPLMEQALDYLCANDWVTGAACTGDRPLAYEVTDEGRGWYLFHLHHMHISFEQVGPSGAPSLTPAKACLAPSCSGRGDGPALEDPRASRATLAKPARRMKAEGAR